jgi:Flagellar hook-length control protein FliK
MTISVNPTIPVIAAQSAASGLVLQPGTVVDAEVLKLLSDNLVRIAISNLAIDVLTEVPLQAGQNLQLAVSQTPDGVRLAVVGAGTAAGTSADTVTLAPDAPINAVANAAPATASPRNVLTPLERVAVSAAAASAATQQDSLAPLFANLGVTASSNSLPPKLQEAVLQVLAQRTSLDPALTGADVKYAFQKSGLFLEASLASGDVPPVAGTPDLKAALIVLRQTLLSSLGTSDGSAAPAAVAQPPVTPAAPGTSAADAASASQPHVAAATSTPSPSLSPEIEVQEILLPQARVPVASDSLEGGNSVRIVLSGTLLNTGPRMAVGTALNLLQEVPRAVATSSLAPMVTFGDGRGDDVTVHTNTPPPPFRGALPAAQPIAAPSIASGAPPATIAHHLLSNTDAAIARQTLLQVASLPDRVDAAGARTDPATPRWNFEIPFVTPQGTAMAQFEISRDGGGNEVEGTKQVWRARFSLDVEPAGPVHALVSLSGERTSVRMWAERPATAAQLRAGAAQLSQALSRAELQPGDIVIRNGAPPQPTPARAGHFLDRAL